MTESVLLDTSFFIRLLNSEDPYHQSALDYYRYFMEKGITMKMSTIAIAEFCVKGSLADLPIRNLMFVGAVANFRVLFKQIMSQHLA
jgi:predicted nucleic acid-binding protein